MTDILDDSARPLRLPNVTDLISRALAEDLGVTPSRLVDRFAHDGDLLVRDVTTSAAVPPGAWFSGVVRAREACTVCGLPVVAQTWTLLGDAAGFEDPVEFHPLVAEGAHIEAGTAVGEVDGPAWTVLAGERSALDLLMILSGMATAATRWQTEAGSELLVVDTRKTLPGMREISKYAIGIGGGTNHRHGLWDMVLVKDNHIRHAGGISAAVILARDAFPKLAIEVEADTIEQAREAASAGADFVLLDNMDDALTAHAVKAVREIAERAGRDVAIEASGGITFDRLKGLSLTDVDRVSTSALTLAPPVDFGLDEVDG
ncbi:MAG: carboxylating nicotinate-nucleotide diphosphorylase [Actinomycetota bacterium]|nr:carboxylating nicotinate-nucleotide diphosphorylase [Actinomycetota bacterium]